MSALCQKRTSRALFERKDALPIVLHADHGPAARQGFRVTPQLAGSMSAHVGCPLLLLMLVSSLWLRRQLKHRCLLSLSQFVPPGAAHSFGNSGSSPARMLLITAPPGHEKYFDELRDLIAKGGKPDPDALAKLRAKYDTVQLATLTPG